LIYSSCCRVFQDKSVYNKFMEKLATILSSVNVGLNPAKVEVEVDVGAGIPSLTIVGLPDKAVEESKERVRLALKNSGFDFPQKKIVVNLAPADIKKEGPCYDLPIAIGVLVAGGLISPERIQDTIFLGELALSGQIRQTRGVVQGAILAKKEKLRLVIPCSNEKEARLILGVEILAEENLKNLVHKILGGHSPFVKSEKLDFKIKEDFGQHDFENIVGQSQAKRVLEIAAAGAHNVLFEGPPGGGKTLLAKSIVSILPSLEEDERLELTKVYSLAGLLTRENPIVLQRPFRSPHHTTSSVAIIGGGTYPKPGEVSLADKGVLFLDEFPEFPRAVLEALRQPLEDKVVTVSRAQSTINFPADFILVAAKNPCPCGFYGDDKHECTCPMQKVLNYNHKISGPLLDRIDLHLFVEKITLKDLHKGQKTESSKQVRARVQKARQIQIQRSQKLFGKIIANGLLAKEELEKIAPLSQRVKGILEQAVDKLDLSMRGYLKVLRLARTIADLEGILEINQGHIAEALQYRIKNGI